MARKYKRLSYEDRKTIEEMCRKDAKWKADFVGTEKDKPATTWFTTVPEPAPKMTEV